MRLINAEALQEQLSKENTFLSTHLIRRIEEAPTVDAVQVIRCKDCKHCNTDWAMGKWYGSCKEWNTHSVMADWYCVNGERIDDE